MTGRHLRVGVVAVALPYVAVEFEFANLAEERGIRLPGEPARSAEISPPVFAHGNAHGAALPAMFERGHLDHLALTAASAEAFADLRRRLVERGADVGEVEDLGAFHAVWFEDPDGMRVELTVIVDPELRGIHEPRPLAAAS